MPNNECYGKNHRRQIGIKRQRMHFIKQMKKNTGIKIYKSFKGIAFKSSKEQTFN